MNRYVAFGARHPYLLAAMAVALFLPWAWAAMFMPLWVALTCCALAPVSAVVTLSLVSRDMHGHEMHPEGLVGNLDQPLFKWQKRTRLLQQVVLGLDTLLDRWEAAAAIQSRDLETLGKSLEEVVKTTEAAVSDISRSFRVVVSKARQQTDVATSLVQEGGDTISVPNLIKGYDGQLASVSQSMAAFSSAAGEIEAHQQRVAEQARNMEKLIDKLRGMSSEISRISLDASVKMTNQTISARDFVDMSDRVRNLATDASDLTRKMQSSLDAIEDEGKAVGARTRKASEAASMAADRAKVEVSRLNGAAMQHQGQVDSVLKRVSDLSTEIQNDINQIILAMQFQDITRQMHEREHKPSIAAAMQALGRLAHETHAMRHRDLYRAVRQYAESAIKLRDRPQAAPIATQNQPVPAVAGSDAKVELF